MPFDDNLEELAFTSDAIVKLLGATINLEEEAVLAKVSNPAIYAASILSDVAVFVL